MRDEAQSTSDQSQTSRYSDAGTPRYSDAGNEAAEAEARPDARAAHTSDEPLYVISVAAKLVGMPAWTLRVLDEQAIVSPRRTDKNRRLYSDRDLMRLARVRTLTEIDGVNMNGVRLILKLEDEQQSREGE